MHNKDDRRTSRTNPRVTEENLVSATVDLAGAVEIETSHVAHYSAEHVQVRVGPVLIYLLDREAAAALHRAAANAASYARSAFAHREPGRLPARLHQGGGQDMSLVVRLRGGQPTPAPVIATVGVGKTGVAVAATIGALKVTCHDAEALHRFTHVASSALRVAQVLWGLPTLDEIEARDDHAARWETERART